MKILGKLLLVISLGCCSLSVTARVTLVNSLVGVKGKLFENIQGRLQSKEQELKGKLTAAKVKAFYLAVPGEIKRALEPYGYFKTKVKSKLYQRGDSWSAVYVITLGPALKVTAITVAMKGEGANDPKFKRQVAKIEHRKGRRFTTVWYARAKESLFTLAAQRGYLVAKMGKSIVAINLQRYTCKISLSFVTGPRYYFGQPLFSKTPFSNKFLARFLNFKPGEHYSGTKVQQVREGFDSSGLFRNADVEPWLKKAKGKRVPLIFHLKAHKSQQYTFGGGYGTDTGIRGLVGVGFYNLTSTGHHFYATSRIAQQLTTKLSKNSPRRQGNFEAHYIIPGPHPATDKFDIYGAAEYEDKDNGLKFGGAFTTIIHNWQQIVRLDVQQDWFTPQQREITTRKAKSSTLVIPGITWLKSKGNDPVRPTRGYRIEFGIKGALPLKPISTVAFFQALLKAKTIYPLSRKTLLVLRGALGYTAVNSVNALPETLLFSAGGSQSIRGYDYEALGPGTELAEASIELRRKVHGHWYGAIFYDIGDAGENIFTNKYRSGVGIGVVWLSPIGAIALSYAIPIGKDNTLGKIQFSMGPEL